MKALCIIPIDGYHLGKQASCGLHNRMALISRFHACHLKRYAVNVSVGFIDFSPCIQSNLAKLALHRHDIEAAEEAIDEAFSHAEELYYKALQQKDDYYQTALQQERENEHLRYSEALQRLA